MDLSAIISVLSYRPKGYNLGSPILREHLPPLKTRLIIVVDLMKGSGANSSGRLHCLNGVE